MRIPSPLHAIDRFRVFIGDVRNTIHFAKPKSFQSLCFSPPYWLLRDYGFEEQVGLERTVDEYIKAQVEIYRGAWEVLRDDGTLWLNVGDKFGRNPKKGGSGTNSKERDRYGESYGGATKSNRSPSREKNLLGIPWRLALAMQEDGWNLRAEIVWSKPNPMPESPQDRPPREHEHIFLFSKQRRYYYDRFGDPSMVAYGDPGDVRPQRTVWEISSQKALVKHFAAFPTKLPERCFSIGASQYGCCPSCRAPYVREIERHRKATRPGKTSIAYKPGNWAADGVKHDSRIAMMESLAVRGSRDPQRHTTKYVLKGWKPSCSCAAGPAVPCLVGDIYHGIGRSMIAADRLSMDYIGFEINPTCIENTLVELEYDRKKRSKGPRKKRLAKPFVQMPLVEEVA